MATPDRLGAGLLRRALVSARPVFLALGVFVLVVLAIRVVPYADPTRPFSRYTAEVVVLTAVGLGALATWWAMRRGSTWDADLWPAIIGGIAAWSLLSALHGTPYAPNGLQGDQSFRTETLTRYADTWRLVDFTYDGLPAFYAPGFFWVLGRLAHLAAVEPWRMEKVGTVAAAMLVPLVTFLFWRRQVPLRVAVLIAAVPLVVENYYEPYSWLVLVAFVPWWLEAVHGITRPGVRRLHPVILGLIGAVLCLTYYYFFFVGVVVLVIDLIVQRMRREVDVGQLRRVAVTFGTIVIATAFYWLPLAISIAGADHPASQANRWFSDPGALPQLPFLDPTPTGLLALIGLAYLVLTARADVLSRALLIFLAGGFAWYLLGWPAAALGAPLLTFRGGPIIELILLTAGVLGLVRMAQIAAARVDATQVRLVASLAAILLVLYAGRSFMLTARLDPTMAVARSEPLPDGTIPRYGMAATKGFVSERTVQQAIESRYSGPGHPVVLSTRPDLLAVSPYYGFVQWQVYYSHPAAEFEDRIAFLRQLAASATSQDLARRAADNAFDKIDAFVLQAHGPNLSFDFRDDNFPSGTKGGTVTFARSLFDSPAFDVVDLGSFVVVVRH